MKFSFIVLLATGLLFSCSSKHSNPDHDVSHSAHAAGNELSLNGEERWQADAATNDNIKQLQDLMQEHRKVTDADSIDALNELGRSMQLGFQEVFNECRMKGPEHDMLHVYLMPMLEDVKVLEKSDAKAAIASRDRLAQRLDMYQTYFK